MLTNLANELAAFVAENADQPAETIASGAERLLAQLQNNLPTDASTWRREAHSVLVNPVAERILQEPPARWSPCLRLLGLWFRAVEVAADDPRRDRSVRMTSGDVPIGKLRLELLAPVARSLLVRATPADRMVFYAAIEDWEVANGLGEALPDLDMQAEELGALVRQLLDFVGNDMAAGLVLEKLRLWASLHPAEAMKTVNRWLDHDAAVGDLRFGGAQLLVEGAVQHGPRGWRTWREDVIRRLAATNRDDLWGLAVHLACFAWPTDQRPEPEERHREVLQHVSRLPSSLVVFGLRSMARDAREHPLEAIRTALKLREMGRQFPANDERRQSEVETALPVVVRNAVWGRRESGVEPGELQFVLAHLADSSLHAAQALDSVLAEFVGWGTDSEPVKKCWSDFLTRHAEAIVESRRSFRELLPLTHDKLGQERAIGWLLQLLVDTRHATRRVAAGLIRGEGGLAEFGLGFGPTAFEGLTDQEAKALSWAAVANGLGEVGIDLVAGIAASLPAGRPSALETLEEVYRHVYPGKVRATAVRWADGEDDELKAAGEALIQSIEHWGAVREASASCPDIALTLQAEPLAGELENIALRQQMVKERESGRWLFWSLATKVPMSRGESSSHGPGQATTPFKSLSVTGEYAFRTRVDPLSTALAVAEAEERLGKLLEHRS